MRYRVLVGAAAFAPLAIAVAVVSSFAPREPAAPALEPLQDSTSASEVQPEQGVSKERSNSKGEGTGPASPANGSDDRAGAPTQEDIEPLGEPMLA